MSDHPSPRDASPRISVVVPVRNDPGHLQQCLAALQKSRDVDCEIIVVDDASTDSTPQVAERMGARLLRLPRQGGPALARNRGAEGAAGEFLLFIDADVCVHPGTLALVLETFAQDPAVDALFGSYDTQPGALNILSQYKNLMHHFVHQQGQQQAATFWAGCGAIRRSVFLQLGGFDTGYRRPCIEDIELGARLYKAGRKIVLNKKIQVTHLKRWTLWGILKSDVRDRALPWTELILRERSLPNDLNLKASQRASALLACGLVAALAIGAWFFPALLLAPVVGVFGIHLLDCWSLQRRVPTTLRALCVLSALAALGAAAYYAQPWMLAAPAFLLGIVLLNLPLYRFFARERHPLFAALVAPLHVLYYLYSVFAFALAVTLHLRKNLARRLFSRTLPAPTR